MTTCPVSEDDSATNDSALDDSTDLTVTAQLATVAQKLLTQWRGDRRHSFWLFHFTAVLLVNKLMPTSSKSRLDWEVRIATVLGFWEQCTFQAKTSRD